MVDQQSKPASLCRVQLLLSTLVPWNLVQCILPYLAWPPVSPEMAVECVLASCPGAVPHLPVALQLPFLRCSWQHNPEVTLAMRTAVVEWLMHGTDVLGLDVEWRVLHRTVLLLDCCMSRHAFPRDKLQLLAVAVLLLACKYEGYFTVTHHTVADLTNGACAAANVAAMEWRAFRLLDFQVGPSTAWEWGRQLAYRRRRALTAEECYRLDASLLQHQSGSRIAVAQQALDNRQAAILPHAILQTRYPDVACSSAKPPKPPLHPLPRSRLVV